MNTNMRVSWFLSLAVLLTSALNYGISLYNTLNTTIIVMGEDQEGTPFSLEIAPRSSQELPTLASTTITYKLKDSLVQTLVYNPVGSMLSFLGVGNSKSWENNPISTTLEVLSCEPDKSIYALETVQDGQLISLGQKTRQAVALKLIQKKMPLPV